MTYLVIPVVKISLTPTNMFINRTHAAQLLAKKLQDFKNANAVVVAIPRGGVPVGYEVARELELSLEIIPCKKIKHPGCADQTIGSVSLNEAFVNSGCMNIPQDYIYHQIALIQQHLQNKMAYYGDHDTSFDNKTIILVDDLLKTGDTMIACIKSLKKLGSKKIILAVPVITQSAYAQVLPLVDAVIFLVMSSESHDVYKFYNDLPKVSHEEVRKLMIKYRDEVYAS